MAFRGSSDVGAFLAGLEPEKEFRSRPIREFSEERSRPIRDFDEEPSVPFFVVDHRPVPDEPRRRYFETDHAPSFSAAAGGTESKTSEPPNLDDARWIEVVGASESEALGELKLKVAETWPGGENWCYIKCQTMEDAAKLLNSRSTVLRDKRVVFNKVRGSSTLVYNSNSND